MACLRCRLKPIGQNAYGNLIEYDHPMRETAEDQPFPVGTIPGQVPQGVQGPRICQCCGAVYCEPVRDAPSGGPPPVPGLPGPPVPPIVPRPPVRW